ncbi:MAG: DUF5067 domain-containing protein [Bacillota bacterium]|jgi:ABC-type glycerol-3-phosphate transport system substrate-binding protein
MKKLLLIVATGLLCLGLVACGSGGTETTNTTATDETANQATDEGNLGDYYVKIKDAKIGESYEGSQALIVTFDFTNNSEENASFISSVSTIAYQDGVQLDTAVLTNYQDDWKKIQPGTTLEVRSAWLLPDKTSPVDVEVSEFISFSDEKLTKTFELE